MLDLRPTSIGIAAGPADSPTRRGTLTVVRCDCQAEYFVWSGAAPQYCAFCGRADRRPGLQDRYAPTGGERDAVATGEPT